MNEGKFIYVFDETSRDVMLKAGFTLLASDAKNKVFVFARDSANGYFSFEGMDHILSNTLSF